VSEIRCRINPAPGESVARDCSICPLAFGLQPSAFVIRAPRFATHASRPAARRGSPAGRGFCLRTISHFALVKTSLLEGLLQGQPGRDISGFPMADDWSREEVEAAVADYFAMLAKELSGIPYNKAEHNRLLQRILVNRSRGSIEFKHQNITAVLIELGFANIPGYKPRYNYQDLLRTVVEDRLAKAKDLQQAAGSAVERPVEAPPPVDDILSILVPPPVREHKPDTLRDKPIVKRKLPLRNYLEAEARNRSLGRAGEEFILRFEHERLWRANKKTLANRIEHIAATQDNLGFDIKSFEVDGRERLIEVKTTRFGAWTPFFASRNEVEVSASCDGYYHLYRLFSFTKQPKLFTLGGSLGRTCDLNAIQFSATPKSVG